MVVTFLNSLSKMLFLTYFSLKSLSWISQAVVQKFL